MNLKPKHCLECGNEFQPKRDHAAYCSANCRATFNNRRQVRGADLYDLFVGLRNDRALAKEKNVWTEMCRLELKWRQEDEKTRQGRPASVPLKAALASLYDQGKLQRGEVLTYAHQVGRGGRG